MDVNSAFLNGYLSKEVFVAQTKGFIDPVNPQHVYKLHKTLYGLKQVLELDTMDWLYFFPNKAIHKRESI